MAPYLGPAYDAAVRLKQIEDRLSRLESNPLGQALSATQSDGSLGMRIYEDPASGATAMVFYHGPSTSRDAQTGQHPELLFAGQTTSNTGQIQDSGVIMLRPTDVASASFGITGPQLLDAAGNVILSSDEQAPGAAGSGLNSPWLPLGQPVPATPSNSGSWPSTTATSLSEVSLLAFPAQHSQVMWYGITYLASGAGEVQVSAAGASGATHSVGAGYTYVGPETFALGSWSWEQVVTLTGNAAVTSGSGPIYFAILGAWGCGKGF